MSQPKSVFLSDRVLVRVGGAEADPFLQGLISNDMNKLGEQRAIYAALLTPQGKYLFDFLLFRRGASILLDADGARAEALIARLLMYRLRAQVVIEREPELAVAAVFGTGAHEAFDLGDDAGTAKIAPTCIAAVDPRHRDLGVRLIGRRDDITNTLRERNIADGRFSDYDRLRISLAVPDGTRDLVEQKSILLEGNFERINGVDFGKGCFVGQELTARTKHRGLVKKRLMRVSIDGEPPAFGTPIMRSDREVGEMRSHADGIGLALMRLDRLREDASTDMVAGNARIRLQEG